VKPDETLSDWHKFDLSSIPKDAEQERRFNRAKGLMQLMWPVAARPRGHNWLPSALFA
jgi:hypothetical protein